MSNGQESLWYRFHGDSAHFGTPIIAARCQDEGVCIMCDECGHVFVPSKPLSDESEPIDSGELAKALYYHECGSENQKDRGGGRRARKP